eukprot:9361781-Karenia_brevis.AAC.1
MESLMSSLRHLCRVTRTRTCNGASDLDVFVDSDTFADTDIFADSANFTGTDTFADSATFADS